MKKKPIIRVVEALESRVERLAIGDRGPEEFIRNEEALTWMRARIREIEAEHRSLSVSVGALMRRIEDAKAQP